MLVEIDEYVIDRATWERVKADDAAAREKLRADLNGMVLYMHNLSVMSDEDVVVVTLRELAEQACVGHIVLSKEP